MCRVVEHAAYATLNLQRIRKLTLLDRQAEVPSDFVPERFENAAFGVHTGGELTRFVLRFEAEVAAYIRVVIATIAASFVADRSRLRCP